MKSKPFFDTINATVTLLKNKELCKTFAKEQSLEDFYLNRVLEEIHNSSKLEKQIYDITEKLEELQEKVDQQSRPIEQRVADLEDQMKSVHNAVRKNTQVTDMWRPMKREKIGRKIETFQDDLNLAKFGAATVMVTT